MSGPVTLRVGKIRYLNCLPYFFGLEEALRAQGLPAIFFESHPASINQAMREGEVHVGPISSLEFLRQQDQYRLVSDLAIGAQIFVQSVVLVSRKRIEALDGGVIGVSEESLSSAVLLRILLKRRYGLRVTYETTAQDPEAMLRKYPAALLIGDGALFCQPKEMVYKYDLGALWQEWTGKPFVFALWAVRRELADGNPSTVSAFAKVLRGTFLKNMDDPERFLEQALGVTPADKKFCILLSYFTKIQYTLVPEMLEGLRRYFELAHEEELAPVPQTLEVLP